MELIRLEYASFRDFARELPPRLTRDGLWLASARPAPVGAEVAFEIDLADGFRLLRGRGAVTAALADGPPEGRGMAIAFRELDAGSRHLVDKIVARHRAAGGSVLVLPVPASEPLESERVGEPPTPAPAEPEQEPVGDLMVVELEEMLATERSRLRVAELAGQRMTRQTEERAGAVMPRGEPIAGRLAVALEGAVGGLRMPGTLEPEPALPAVARARPSRPAGGSRRRRRVARSLVVLAGLAGLAWMVALASGRHEESESPVRPPIVAAPGPPVAPATSPPVTAASEPSFTRVVAVSAVEEGETTVIALTLDGAAARDRWAVERLSGDRPREVVTLFGVADLPRPSTLEVGGARVARLRSGLHAGPRGPELHLVIDLAAPEARLAGVEVGERSLRLVFLGGGSREIE